MLPLYEYEQDYVKFDLLKSFITDFSQTMTMSNSDVRQGFLEFSGPVDDGSGPKGPTIGPYLLFNDSTSTSLSGFTAAISSLIDMKGTTNTPEAINFVREVVLTPETDRLDSFRIVILGTDGFPTNAEGVNDQAMADQAEAAAINLQLEDNAIFVFLQIGDASLYPPNWFRTIADKVYEVSSFSTLYTLLTGGDPFLCMQLTHRPSLSPTITRSKAPSVSPSTSPITAKPSSQPSKAPSKSPSHSPTTSRPSVSPTLSPTTCTPGVVTCCVSFAQLLSLSRIDRTDI